MPALGIVQLVIIDPVHGVGDAKGKVSQVVDDKDKDDNARPDHVAGCNGSDLGTFEDIPLWPGEGTSIHQPCCQPQMRDEKYQQADPGSPQQRGLTLQPGSVSVERISTLENEQISSHMSKK